MELPIGQSFGDYEILGVLGAGGMGKVYKVRNKISNRVEAMKILLSGLNVEPELVDRFTREIRIFGSLDHPNIAELRTALRVENQLVMIMEFVEGSTLDALMKQGRIPTARYVDYMSQALSALSYAHSKGVVHRDIKPANMMLTPQGVIKLMDFGIAKAVTDPQLTKTGFVVGSVYYVPPEQIEGKDLDARSDLYSLGVTMYELATGKRPFDGTSDYQIISAHMKDTPAPPRELDPTLPPELNDIIMLALQKDPNQRFQTAEAFKNALACLGGPVRPPQTAAPVPVQAPALPPITPAPAVAAKRNNRLLYMLAGSAATIAVIVAAVIEVPKLMHTSAAGQPDVPQTTITQPAVKPEAALPTSPVQDTAPVPVPEQAAVPPPSRPVPGAQQVVHQSAQVRPALPTQAQPTPAQQPVAVPQPVQQPPVQQQVAPPTNAGNAAAVAELQERANLMSVRVGTVRTSFQNLQRQQAATGLSPRSDMVAADQRLGYQFGQAETSLQQGNVAAAKQRLDAAERDLERLESFLGK